MDFRLLEAATKVATPLALVGVVLVLLFGLFRTIVRAKFMPVISKTSAFRLLSQIVNYGFVLGLVVVFLGVGSYLLVKRWSTHQVGDMYISSVVLIQSEYHQHYHQAMPPELLELIEAATQQIREGSYIAATRLFQQAAQQAPEIAGILNNLGVAYAQQGDAQRAREAFAKALSVAPDNDLVRRNEQLHIPTLPVGVSPQDPRQDPPTPRSPPADPEGVITRTMTPVSAISLSPVRDSRLPQIDEVWIVEQDVPLTINTKTVQTGNLGTPLIVSPGNYDIAIRPSGSNAFKLLHDLAVHNRETVEIETESLLSSITVNPHALEGFPKIDAIHLRLSEEGSRTWIHHGHKPATSILVAPGEYDVGYEANEQRAILVKGVKVTTGQHVELDADELAAAIACRNLGIPGFELKSVLILAAGTPLEGQIVYLASADSFDVPILVSAGDRYDVAVEPKGGQLFKLAENVQAKGGRITWVGGVK